MMPDCGADSSFKGNCFLEQGSPCPAQTVAYVSTLSRLINCVANSIHSTVSEMGFLSMNLNPTEY
jgi:hypothetical protein